MPNSVDQKLKPEIRIDGGISNPQYSPVVPKRPVKNTPEYIEMGVTNSGFAKENQSNNSPLTSFAKSINLNDSSVNAENGPIYLTPVTDKGQLANHYSKPSDPQYEDLGHVVTRIGQSQRSSVASSVGLPKKKANILYEPSTVNKRKAKYKDDVDSRYVENDTELPCLLIFVLVVIGILALLGSILSVLMIGGALKVKNCDCNNNQASSGSTGSSVGSSPSQDPSINLKILELESNITTLKAKMKPQEKELEMLKNQSKEYQRTIQSLQVRLLEEEAKSKSLNSSVAILNDLQASLQLASNQMKVTLSSNITELKEKIKNQELKIDSVDVRPNITSLEIKIDKEIKQRQENDSGLSDKLESQSKLQQTLITNLTNDLATLKQKTNLDIWNFHNVLSVAINNSIKARKQSDEKLLSRINYLNTTLLNQVKNISLTPGPKGPMGPSGAGNLSRCTHQRRAVQGIGTSLHYVVLVVPPDSNPWVLLGVFCSSNIASSNTYETDRRKCRCTASVRQSFFCYSDSWWCPLIS